VIDENGITHGMPGHDRCIVRDPSVWQPGQPLCNPQHLPDPATVDKVGEAWRIPRSRLNM
jgi:hypothetical protein